MLLPFELPVEKTTSKISGKDLQAGKKLIYRKNSVLFLKKAVFFCIIFHRCKNCQKADQKRSRQEENQGTKK